MFLRRLLRKLGKMVRGGVAPRQIVLGAVLGVIIGFIPGFNLTLLLALAILFLLNAHVGIALLGFGLAKGCSLVLAPVTYRIGYFLIHDAGLEPAFRAAANAPVLALMDLQAYCLTGGLPVALVLGLACGWLVVKVVTALRVGIVEATARSERMQRLARNKLVRLFMWLVFGRQKGDIADMLKKRPPLFRKSGVVLTVLVLAAALILEVLLLDASAKAAVEGALGAVNGAEVNLEQADVSLLSGRLALRGLQVTDADEPARNKFQAEDLAADVSIRDLLRGRCVVNLLAVRNVELDAERETPGEVFEEPDREERTEADEEGRELLDYFERADTLRRYLAKLYEFLKRNEAPKAEEDAAEEAARRARAAEEGVRRGYLSATAKGFLAERATWLIERMSIEGVRLPGLSTPQDLEGKYLSSHPGLVPEPMSLTLTPQEGGEATVAVEFNFGEPGAMHSLAVNVRDVAIAEAVSLSGRAPVDVQDGRADLRLEGEFSADAIRFPFSVDVSSLVASSREGRSVLGLDPEVAQKVFESLGELRVEGAITGGLTSPRLRIDPASILANLKDSLQRAGKEQLARLANEGLQTVKDKLADELGEELKDRLPSDILKGLPGLGTDEEEEDEDEGEEDLRDIIRGVF